MLPVQRFSHPHCFMRKPPSRHFSLKSRLGSFTSSHDELGVSHFLPWPSSSKASLSSLPADFTSLPLVQPAVRETVTNAKPSTRSHCMGRPHIASGRGNLDVNSETGSIETGSSGGLGLLRERRWPPSWTMISDG